MSSKIKQILYSYLQEDRRISVKLSICLHRLMESTKPISYLRKVLKKTSQPIKVFRLLILMHQCYMNNVLQCQEAIRLLSEIRGSVKRKINQKLDLIIYDQVINPYVLYLQKCYQTQNQAFLQQDLTTQQILYRYLNLLKLGLSFVDILYTFGRYFKETYQFIVDFNIILGKDLNLLYQNRIKTQLKKNKCLWNQQMKLQLEKIHENMYVVYYNCYFYKWLKLYVPKWIDTQNNSHKRHLSLSPSKLDRSLTYKTPNNKLSISKLDTGTVQNNKNCKIKGLIMTTQMSMSSIGGQTRPSPEDYQSNKQSSFLNSTMCYSKQSRYIRQRRKEQSSSLNKSCVSDFIYDLNEKKQQYIIDQIQSQNQYEFTQQIPPVKQNQKDVKNKQINLNMSMKLKGKNKENTRNRIEDPQSLLESMQRVVQKIDMSLSKVQCINLNESKCHTMKKDEKVGTIHQNSVRKYLIY